MTIPYDVLIHIFAFSNTRELFNAALASRDLNVVASQYLYANVILSLPLWNTNASKGPGPRSGIAAFMFALLPKYAPFVRNLEVSGYFAGTSVQVNELQRALVKGLKAFVNIQSIKICPTTYEGNYFAEHLTILQECSSLRVLDVNSSCFDYGLQAMPVLPANPFSALFAIAESEEREEDPAEQVPHPLSRAELVANISGLTKLTLRDPSNTILQLLVRCWLNRLSKTLVELHLQGNCSSIAPAILSSAIPQLQQIGSLSIGSSHPLTDHELFSALSQLPCLHTLSVSFHPQHTSPLYFPAPQNLKSLTVHHKRLDSRRQSDVLCDWVRKVTDHSPIESLSLVSYTAYVYGTSTPSIDVLLDHLINAHAARLRVLSLASCFVGTRALKRLCMVCSQLEQLSVGGRLTNLQMFVDTASHRVLPLLHTVSFSLLNEKRFAQDLQVEFVPEIMKSYPMLRRVSVDWRRWEGSWASHADGNVQFLIQEVKHK